MVDGSETVWGFALGDPLSVFFSFGLFVVDGSETVLGFALGLLLRGDD